MVDGRAFKSADLEELEGRRTFSAFLTSGKAGGDTRAGLSPQTASSYHHRRGGVSTQENTRETEPPGFACFIAKDKHVYRQRTWMCRLARQEGEEQIVAIVPLQHEEKKSLLPHTSKKKKKSKNAGKKRSNLTPGSTLMSIGEACEEVKHNAAPIRGVDVKAWPAFRQYKSLVTASQQTRVPKFVPKPVVLRGDAKRSAPAGLPPTLANIINAHVRNQQTASPQLSARKENSPAVPLDPMFPLHLVRLAVLDGEEDRACRLLGEFFGVSPDSTIAAGGKIKASLLAKPKFWPVLLRIWLRALDRGMDRVLLQLLELGVPPSPLAPISFIPAKKPVPLTTPKFYSLANLASSVSILSTGSSVATNATATHNWLQRNFREWFLDRFPCFLLAAIAFRRARIVMAMLEKIKKSSYALVNSAAWIGFTPLLLACSGRGNLQLGRYLLDLGADPLIGISYYQFLMARRKFLYRHDPNLKASRPIQLDNQIEWSKMTPLLPIDVAAASVNFELVLSLLGRSLVTTQLGLLLQQDLDISVRLLKAGAIVNETDQYGNSPLHKAAAMGRPDLLALYLHYGSPIDGVNAQGNTALHEAAQHGSIAAMRHLIQAGASCSAQNHAGLTALEVARRHGFSSEQLADFLTGSTTSRDMRELIQQVDQFNLKADLDRFNRESPPRNAAQPPRDPTTSERKGRFLIERIINPRQWWS